MLEVLRIRDFRLLWGARLVGGPALATGLSLTATAVVACALSAAGALVGLLVVPVDPDLVAVAGR